MIKSVLVVGAGQMGSGIAQVCAAAAYEVLLLDKTEELIRNGLLTIEKNLQHSVGKERISRKEMAETMERIKPITETQEADGVDLVIEAIVEDIKEKEVLFRLLDKACPPHTILATNTSSLPITTIASFTERPDKVIGMHFMNPVPVMKLVEVIRGLATSEETFLTIRELSTRLGKTAVAVHDYPGFVSNRILMPMINEAVYCLMEGVAGAEEIDSVMKMGMNHPMGPLTLADFIGLDTCLAIMEVLYEGFGDSKYRPCPLLRKYVSAGWLGRKSGRGFYPYP